MKDAPNIDFLLVIDVEDEIRESARGTRPQTGDTELVRVARRTDCGVIADGFQASSTASTKARATSDPASAR